jgi:hypothetical protein
MKLFRTLALIGAGLLVRKWVAHRAAAPKTTAERTDGFDIDTRPMAYPLENDSTSTPEASAPGQRLTDRPVYP